MSACARKLTVIRDAHQLLGAQRLGVALARRLVATVLSLARWLSLYARPIRATRADLETALRGRDCAGALTVARDALPALRRWEHRLGALSKVERADLLRRAGDILAHRFDLLGSGPTELGPDINWHRDFKSGRTWPRRHYSLVPIAYPDCSDIKVPWELSRCQHLPLLAAAHNVTGEPAYLNELGKQLVAWIETNPVEIGVNWRCTMDVAIRAVNWVAALALCGDAVAAQPWSRNVLASLLLHARFISTHLEDRSPRGNHYLSNVVGLLIAAAPFSGSREGQRWVRWAIQELGREMQEQVRTDGCAHEASTSYHRLVTEMFVLGADAADVLEPGALDPHVRQGVERMLGFVTNYTRADGLAPQIGDADNGRLLPLGDYRAADQRSHLHLFEQANRPYHPPRGSAAYPAGGFYILRSGELHAVIRCGDVGMDGLGCHAHNDINAFELSVARTSLVVDPGSYLYTADPELRNRFRATAAHSTLQIDDAEQNEIRADRLFAMVDRARPEVIAWQAGSAAATFTGRHRGFEALPTPAVHTRTIHLDGTRETLEIIDEVASNGAHDLSWCFPLAPSHVRVENSIVIATFGDVTLHLESEGLEPTIGEGLVSPGYGSCFTAPVVRLRDHSKPGIHRRSIMLTVIHPSSTEPA